MTRECRKNENKTFSVQNTIFMMRYVVYGDIRIPHISQKHNVCQFMLMLLQSVATLYARFWKLGTIAKCCMLYLFLVVFIGLSTSKSFVKILVDRYETFLCEKIKIILLLFFNRHTYVKRNYPFVQPPKRNKNPFKCRTRHLSFLITEIDYFHTEPAIISYWNGYIKDEKNQFTYFTLNVCTI